MTRPTVLLLSLASILMSGLMSGACADGVVAGAGPIVRDSAGIRIVESPGPAWADTARRAGAADPLESLRA